MIAVWLGVALAARPEVPAPDWPPAPRPEAHRLSDGTPVWLLPRSGQALVQVELNLSRGWGAEPALGALVGELLGQGTVRLKAEAWEQALEELGAEAALGLGPLRSWGSLQVLRGGEAQALPLLIEALVEPALPRRDLRRTARAWARDQRGAHSSVQSVQLAAISALLFDPVHPFGHLIAPSEYRGLQPSHARQHWAAIRTEGAPSVVAVGDFEPRAMLALLEQEIAGLFTGNSPPLALPPPRAPRREVVLVDMPGLEQVLVLGLLPGPAEGHPDQLRWELAQSALGGLFTSRLNLALREEEGLTYGVETRPQIWPGAGWTELRTILGPQGLLRGLERMERELDSYQADGPGELELRQASATWLRLRVEEDLDLPALSHRLAWDLLWGRSPREEGDRREAARRANPAELKLLCQQSLERGKRRWVLVGDRDLVEPLIEPTEWAPTRVWSSRALLSGDVTRPIDDPPASM